MGMDVGTGSVRAALVDQRAPSWALQTSPSISGSPSSTTMSSRPRTSGPQVLCCLKGMALTLAFYPACFLPTTPLLSVSCVSIWCQGQHKGNFRHWLCLWGSSGSVMETNSQQGYDMRGMGTKQTVAELRLKQPRGAQGRR